MGGVEAALACVLLKAAGGKLVSLIASEFESIMGVKKDLSELQDILQQITRRLSYFQDRETESNTSFSWVKLKDVAYDIVDLLDDGVRLEAEKQNMESNDDKHYVAHCFRAKQKSFVFQFKMAQKIKAIRVKLDEIVRQTRYINSILQDLPLDQPVPQRNSATMELYLLGNSEDSKIPTMDQEKDMVVAKLVEESNGENVTVVSIVGIGGSGKTTLAKHICDHGMIKEHFRQTIFRVHVSREFDVDRLMGKLFEQITKEKPDHHSRSHIVSVISNKLNDNKFLLVLDDAWEEDRVEWEQFLLHIKYGAPGSRVLLTTRNENVAEAVKSWHTFHLRSLTELESWSFFLGSCELAEEDLDSERTQLVKEILKKCGGVPLGIKILGGVLHGNMEVNTLRAIRGSKLWEDKGIEVRVFACLKLSYIHLKDHLKQCFMFCSIFPKGYRIRKDYLIEQWIAHGFIKQTMEEQPEDSGRKYFDSLVKVGFPLEILYDNTIVTYKMHDLIHDLAQYILGTELWTSVRKKMTRDNCSHRCRYLSLTSCNNEKVDMALFGKLRALYVSEGNPSFDKPANKGCYTRSVVLDYATENSFPLFILKMEHLGYLEIHNLSCTKLPEAISGCWNLQSLHFIHCNGFVTLPKSIGKLKKLRILELKYVTDLESLPQSIGECHNLQSLKLYACWELRHIPSSIGRLKNLRVLNIVHCSSLQQHVPSEFTSESSILQSINLSGSWRIQGMLSTFVCPMLRKLDLSETGITALPQWVTTIGTLECIDLAFCNELVELPKGIGKLKRLEVLNIKHSFKLCCMPPGIGQLTRLTQLGLFVVGCVGDGARISELGNLDMLSGGMRIRNLKYLKDPCDAEKACLKRKNNIHSLRLDWCWSETELKLATDIEHDQGVLNALEPSSQIKTFEICRYRGPCLPSWMLMQNDPPYCEGIKLKQSSSCQFMSLAKLTLQEFPNLRHMRGVVVLPSLNFLTLRKMPNLEELWITTNGFEICEEDSKAEYCFPALSILVIRECPKLEVKPYFPPSLDHLHILDCNEQLLSLRAPITNHHPPGRFCRFLTSGCWP